MRGKASLWRETKLATNSALEYRCRYYPAQRSDLAFVNSVTPQGRRQLTFIWYILVSQGIRSIIFQYCAPMYLVLNKTFGAENLKEGIKTLLEGSNSKKKARHTDNPREGRSQLRIRHLHKHSPVGPVYCPSICSCYSLSVLAQSLQDPPSWYQQFRVGSSSLSSGTT